MFETLKETLYSTAVVTFITYKNHNNGLFSVQDLKNMIKTIGMVSTTVSPYATSSRILYTDDNDAWSRVSIEFTVKPFRGSDVISVLRMISPNCMINGDRKFRHFTIIFE